VEKDDRLVRILRKQLKNFSNVQILHCDALRMQLPYFDKVVSNLPYWISSEIIFKLLEKRFKLGVLMLQKEFADRLVAKPGTEDYSRLAVNVHYRADVELHDEVPPAAFYPEPKVTSRIVIIRPRESAFKIFDEKKFSALVRALFQHRRQRVRNALLRSFTEVFPGRNLSKAKRRKFIDEKIPKELADARVIDLYPEKFGEISNLLTSP
jgi:16S rRNA (adenine1518-N6/adenine1519-N6)-dimethyltransferase